MGKGKQQDTTSIEARWGKTTTENGWIAVPNALLARQAALKICPVQMNILLVLLKYWWNKDDMPFPSKQTIADMIGREASTVQRQIKSLEQRGLVRRESRFNEKNEKSQTTNRYDLSGLVEKLNEFTTVEIEIKKQQEQDAKVRQKSKKIVSSKVDE